MFQLYINGLEYLLYSPFIMLAFFFLNHKVRLDTCFSNTDILSASFLLSFYYRLKNYFYPTKYDSTYKFNILNEKITQLVKSYLK